MQGWVPETKIFEHLTIVSGRSLHRDDGKAALIGTVLAKNLDKKVGDSLPLFDDQFRIAGIYHSSNVFEEGAVVIPLAELQRLMERQGQVTGFSVIMQKPTEKASIDRARKEIESLAPGLTALPTDGTSRASPRSSSPRRWPG